MTTPPDALAALEIALERLAAAMATGRPDAVLAADEPLAAAVRRLAACQPPTRADRAGVHDGVRAVRVALMKCRLLGRASAALEQALALHPAYTARGSRVVTSVPATLESRT